MRQGFRGRIVFILFIAMTMKLSTATRIFITLDWDDFSDWQVIDMIYELCILVDQWKDVQEAFDKICEVYGIVLPTNEKTNDQI